MLLCANLRQLCHSRYYGLQIQVMALPAGLLFSHVCVSTRMQEAAAKHKAENDAKLAARKKTDEEIALRAQAANEDAKHQQEEDLLSAKKAFEEHDKENAAKLAARKKADEEIAAAAEAAARAKKLKNEAELTALKKQNEEIAAAAKAANEAAMKKAAEELVAAKKAAQQAIEAGKLANARGVTAEDS